jgi:hypothetical protein
MTKMHQRDKAEMGRYRQAKYALKQGHYLAG